jgi:hypothetical protein
LGKRTNATSRLFIVGGIAQVHGGKHQITFSRSH